MQLMNEIPDGFWGLFRSCNRRVYMNAILRIHEEYQYNNYFLSMEMCVRVLNDYFSNSPVSMMRDEQETEEDAEEPAATRVLNWLIRAQWLKKLEDYTKGVTHIVIPDYAAVFVEAFERLLSEEEEDADIYIQSIYGTLFSYKNDSRGDVRLLRTALVNTRKLNKALQNMLHNMDRFFASLLKKDFYGDLLKEHLNGYVEEIVKKKYHILKTSDNFYQYKSDIKKWLKEISGQEEDEAFRLVEEIERGFRDIEKRIFYMDQEHSRYVRATVARLQYLLDGGDNGKGLVVRLLNSLSDSRDREERVKAVGEKINFSQINILSEKSLYKRRKEKRSFLEQLEPEPVQMDLSREDVISMNRLHNRYSRRQIEEFLEKHMENGEFLAGPETVNNGEEYELLILAYDYALKKESAFTVEASEKIIDQGAYSYPALRFYKKEQETLTKAEEKEETND